MPNLNLIRNLKKINVSRANYGLYENVLRWFLDIKSKSIYKRIGNYIKGDKVLDIGTGVGGIAADLKEKGFNVTSVDVRDFSLFNSFPTDIYDGYKLPYRDKTFDTALLIHVLHHCDDGIEVLREAMRVSNRVVFIEDTYRSEFERKLVSLFDMMGNNEFYDHDYKTPREWEKIIARNGWKVLGKDVYSELLYGFMYGRYVMFAIST